MFESDDLDQVLSQFDFPDFPKKENQFDVNKNESKQNKQTDLPVSVKKFDPLNMSPIPSTSDILVTTITNNFKEPGIPSHSKQSSPKPTKRKIIHSLFDYNSKRKFPGPAGLLSGNFDESKDDSLGQMEFLSQDIDFSQNNHQRHLFESSVWKRLHNDVKDWNLGSIDTIKCIKDQALAGNLRRRKANVITAFIEMVDRSVADPFISLRDTTGNIKGTLHRDAWTQFSPYIASQHCALVLWKPTILTTGGAFKKHYLNITLSNIKAIYSSVVLNEDLEVNLIGFQRICEEEFTIIKSNSSVEPDCQNNTSKQDDGSDLLEGLDSSIFLDEEF